MRLAVLAVLYVAFAYSAPAVEAQRRKFRLFGAIYKDCGSAFQVTDVRISAPPGRKCNNRHLLVKKRKVQICLNATIPADPRSIPEPIVGAGLKNVAHGTLVGAFHEKFCELDVDGCRGASPGCGEMTYGSNVELCSVLTVPDVPLIEPDVAVRWRVLRELQFDRTCEEDWDLSPDRIPLVCIDLDAKVVNEPKC